MSAKAKLETTKEEVKHVIAKLDDGTIQITYTVPLTLIEKEKLHAAEELGKDVDVPGFRKGKAPVDQVLPRLNQEKLIQHTLSHILPMAFGKTIQDENLKPIVYPKFELIKAEEGKEWEVRATTCEAPEIKLGDYKQSLALRAKKNSTGQGIWTPEKDAKAEEKKEPTIQEKETEVIKVLLEEVKVTIPRFLVEEEVNNRLSQLLSQIEKLGLTLESYLNSVGKNPDKIREEYAATSESTLKIDFILSKIAGEEKIVADEKSIEEAMKVVSADPKMAEMYRKPEQKRYLESIIIKRKTLDSLIALL